ncbi:MAG: hypothetical protein EBU90_11140 [Proteobacteria bacterium]|jgi:hypothetical protein|nr:hypothetical protein [Pseudomonadota bacterium]
MSEENVNLEDNLQMAQYIMLARIYDLISVLTSHMTEKPELIQNIVSLHEQGHILGPMPAFKPKEENESTTGTSTEETSS